MIMISFFASKDPWLSHGAEGMQLINWSQYHNVPVTLFVCEDRLT